MRLLWLRYRWQMLAIGFGISTSLIFLVWWFNHSAVVPRPVTAAVAQSSATPVWDVAAHANYQQDVVAALNCARQAQASSDLVVSPALQTEAQAIAHEAQTSLDSSIPELLAEYDWSAMVAVSDFAQPAASGCGWASYDFSTLDLIDVDEVGVAVLPPVDYAPATVIVLGRSTE